MRRIYQMLFLKIICHVVKPWWPNWKLCHNPKLLDSQSTEENGTGHVALRKDTGWTENVFPDWAFSITCNHVFIFDSSSGKESMRNEGK